MRILVATSLLVTVILGVQAQDVGIAPSLGAYRPDRIMVMPKPGVEPDTVFVLQTQLKTQVLRRYAGIGGLQVLSVPAGETVMGLIEKF